MSFMQPHVTHGGYFEVESYNGTTILPADLFIGGLHEIEARCVKDYIEGDLIDPEEMLPLKQGWLARMSAPGYMDCTDWSAFDTQWEALAYLVEHYMEETHYVTDVPSHFLSALINDDSTGLSDEDESELRQFLDSNPEAHRIESTCDDSHFDGYQDVTPCICRHTE